MSATFSEGEHYNSGEWWVRVTDWDDRLVYEGPAPCPPELVTLSAEDALTGRVYTFDMTPLPPHPLPGVEGEPQMSDTVHVTIAQDDDEQLYAYESSPGDTDGETGVYETDVPVEMWAQVDEAWRTIRTVFDQVRLIAGVDPDDWRLREPCAAWLGQEYPAKHWWAITIPRATDAETRPQREVTTGHFDTEVAARAFLDALPDQFVIVEHRPWLIEKAMLTIEHQGYDAHVYECDRCGWSRESHAATPSNPGSPRA